MKHMAANKINDTAKLQSFARYVTSDAAKQRAALARELDERWARMVDETELALYGQAYEKIQRCRTELTHATNEALSREKLSCKRRLSARRSEMMGTVLETVRTELTTFTKSADYYPWLLRASRGAVRVLGEGNIILYLNGTDAAYVQKLASDTGCRVELLAACARRARRRKGGQQRYTYGSEPDTCLHAGGAAGGVFKVLQSWHVRRGGSSGSKR